MLANTELISLVRFHDLEHLVSRVKCLQAYFKRMMLAQDAGTVMPTKVWYLYGKFPVVDGSADGAHSI